MAQVPLSKYAAALLLLLSLIPAPSLARDEVPTQVAQALTTEAISQQLMRGEIVIAAFTPDQPTTGMSMWAALRISASPEKVFAAISLCEQAVRWYQKLKSCQQLDQGPGFTEYKQRVKLSWYLPELNYSFRASYPYPGEIRFQALSGDLKTLQGGWDLYPRGGATLALYFITIEPKLPSPDWLMKKTMRKDLSEMLLTISKIVAADKQ